MNDKLIQIGLDSGMLNYVDNETPRHYFLSGHADEQDLQKFAELIVQECVNLMYNSMQNTDKSYDLAHHAMLAQLIAEIKNQFGIAESKREKFDNAMKDAFKNGVDLSGKETP